MGFCGLRRAARRAAGSDPAWLRLGAEIRRQLRKPSRSRPSRSSELNQITNGEKNAKPAPQPRARAAASRPQTCAHPQNQRLRRSPRRRRRLKPSPRRQSPRRRPKRRRRLRPSLSRAARKTRAAAPAEAAIQERRPPVRPKIARHAARAAQGAGAGQAEASATILTRTRSPSSSDRARRSTAAPNQTAAAHAAGPPASRRAAHVDVDGLGARRLADGKLPQLLDAAANDA